MPISVSNKPLLPASALLAALALAACGNKPSMPDTPPAPKAAQDTQMRDAIKQPLDQAKAAAALEQQTAQQQRKQIDAATQTADSPSKDSP